VAVHAVDLARIRLAHSLVIVGAGPIGLLVLQAAKLAGADPSLSPISSRGASSLLISGARFHQLRSRRRRRANPEGNARSRR